MGRLHQVYLEGKIYSCLHCQSHLALYEDIVSKDFHSRHGKAYLFNTVVNARVGRQEERLMTTGMHTVADIFCIGCGSLLGWKYVAAHEKSQKYKEGRFILERAKVTGPDGGSYWMTLEAQVVGSDADDA
ncbi:unnamed protein product [Spirodela intermedia]|uniref:Protein yippee-like n=1 Tax=Spirodela intermedia TaxID=51605 RepID=A0A7I8K258_SPIIN|nr:unnamed protein product [Spirodela intermedia]